MSKETEFTTKDGWKVKIDNEVLEKMSKETKDRPRVEDINKCSTPADIAEYLEDNPFGEKQVEYMQTVNPHLTAFRVDEILNHALYKPTNLNFTQYQLKLQEYEAEPRAYSVLLRIMEIRFSLERLDL